MRAQVTRREEGLIWARVVGQGWEVNRKHHYEQS